MDFELGLNRLVVLVPELDVLECSRTTLPKPYEASYGFLPHRASSLKVYLTSSETLKVNYGLSSQS